MLFELLKRRNNVIHFILTFDKIVFYFQFVQYLVRICMHYLQSALTEEPFVLHILFALERKGEIYHLFNFYNI